MFAGPAANHPLRFTGLFTTEPRNGLPSGRGQEDFGLNVPEQVHKEGGPRIDPFGTPARLKCGIVLIITQKSGTAYRRTRLALRRPWVSASGAGGG